MGVATTVHSVEPRAPKNAWPIGSCVRRTTVGLGSGFHARATLRACPVGDSARCSTCACTSHPRLRHPVPEPPRPKSPRPCPRVHPQRPGRRQADPKAVSPCRRLRGRSLEDDGDEDGRRFRTGSALCLRCMFRSCFRPGTRLGLLLPRCSLSSPGLLPAAPFPAEAVRGAACLRAIWAGPTRVLGVL
jgi:hypothetical protein